MALRGHRETVGEGVCDGGNFLALIALVAQYDEVLSELISLPSRATKYLSAAIQNELITLVGTTSLINFCTPPRTPLFTLAPSYPCPLSLEKDKPGSTKYFLSYVT